MTQSTSSTNEPTSLSSLSLDEKNRYSRHLMLNEIGEAGQHKLKRSHIVVLGVGGLGSPVAQYLAAAGVGKITVVDHDVVDASNLQRQTLFVTAQIGQQKAACAAERLIAMNNEINVAAVAERFTAKNARDVCADANVLIDCSDNLVTRYLASDTCAQLGIPYVYGSIAKFEGMIAVFDADVGPCYRCLHPNPPAANAIQNCADAGVLGVLPAVVGSIQATEALKFILGIGKSLTGRLLTYDALRMSFSELRLPKDPNCRHCGPNKIPAATEPSSDDAACYSERMDQISVSTLSTKLVTEKHQIQIVDVRSKEEWNIGHLQDSIHLPLPELEREFHRIDGKVDVIFICRSGMRSDAAVHTFRQLTGKDSLSLTGGLLAWRDSISPAFQI